MGVIAIKMIHMSMCVFTLRLVLLPSKGGKTSAFLNIKLIVREPNAYF